jgi:hypothetical protein
VLADNGKATYLAGPCRKELVGEADKLLDLTADAVEKTNH